jgi:benzoyl-CoA reductase/2-hydroxyglutaryl-CoA dehydratase subunit BcrC/BadD/HgdB
MSRFKKQLEKKFHNKISYEEFGELIKMVQKFNDTASRRREMGKKKEDVSKG